MLVQEAAALLMVRQRSLLGACGHLPSDGRGRAHVYNPEKLARRHALLERRSSPSLDQPPSSPALAAQEPLLTSLDVHMPSWAAVGGERLVHTAKAAGESALLLILRQICGQSAHRDSGPYSDAVRADDVLQCMERFAQHDILAEWVRSG